MFVRTSVAMVEPLVDETCSAGRRVLLRRSLAASQSERHCVRRTGRHVQCRSVPSVRDGQTIAN